MSRLNNDVSGVQDVVTSTFSQSLNNILMSGITVATMLLLDWRLTLLSLVFLPLFILPTLSVGKITFKVKKKTQSKLAELSSLMQETVSISGMLLVKTFRRQNFEVDRFRETNAELMKLQIRQKMVGRSFFISVYIIQNVAPAILYWYGGHMIIDQKITLGTVIAFTTLLSQLYQPVASLASLNVNIIGSIALFDRLFEYLEMPIEIQEKASAVSLQQVEGRVELENVSFHYNENQPVLQNVSFTISPGQVVALVGPSGSGKTSISNLVARLYDPTSGRVLLDGHDLRDLTLETLGEQIGFVTQETYLFHAKILENLRYGRLDATMEEIVEAAKAANIHDTIMRLEKGYDTMVGERGHKLSGGEKQRIAIVRLILKSPKILILDEATSALDTHSESLIQEAFEKLMTNRTSLVIAHRLSTIQNADQILVLSGGEVVERGTHEQLLLQDGLYADLYKKQFSNQELEVQI